MTSACVEGLSAKGDRIVIRVNVVLRGEQHFSSGCRRNLANGEKWRLKFDGKLGQYFESDPIAPQPWLRTRLRLL
jgi:hypothetical protein